MKKTILKLACLILIAVSLAACTENKAEITGAWIKQNAEVATTLTFTKEGDFSFKLEKAAGTKSSVSVSTGKYEVTGDNLRLFDPPSKNGTEKNIKIVRLDEKTMILESELKGEKVRETYARQ